MLANIFLELLWEPGNRRVGYRLTSEESLLISGRGKILFSKISRLAVGSAAGTAGSFLWG